MYQAESARLLVQGRTAPRPRVRLRVSRKVVLLGLTSLLTDVSAEMVATVLPIYAVFALGASPLQYGLLDGLYQGAAGIVRIASGVVADRRRYKELAAFGYGISAACKGALLAIGGTVGGLSAIILADRLGKGVRTEPRDALISLSSTREGSQCRSASTEPWTRPARCWGRSSHSPSSSPRRAHSTPCSP